MHRATAMEGEIGIKNKEWNFGKALTLCLPERWKKYLNKINIQNLLSTKLEKILKEYNQEYYKTRLTEEDTHCHRNDITQTLAVFCHRKSITFQFIMIPHASLTSLKAHKNNVSYFDTCAKHKLCDYQCLNSIQSTQSLLRYLIKFLIFMN